jgi:2-dehydropantoate 2-reductase
MTIHILGFGSIGILSAHLLRAAHPLLSVCYLPRPKSSSLTKTFTVRDSSDGCTQLSDLINDVDGTKLIQVLLVTTKAHHTRNAIEPYSRRLTAETLMIFLQNGMGIVDSIRDILPSRRIIIGTTTHACYRIQKNQVQWVFKGETYFSPTPNVSLSQGEYSLLSALGHVVSYSALEERLYRKLALNACINPVTAIYNVLNGSIADTNSPVHSLSIRLAKEIQQVYGVLRPGMDMSRLVEEIIQLANNTAGNTSSMLADVRAGKETEIDFINGYIAKKGRDAGVNVHENEGVIRSVKELTT